MQRLDVAWRPRGQVEIHLDNAGAPLSNPVFNFLPAGEHPGHNPKYPWPTLEKQYKFNTIKLFMFV